MLRARLVYHLTYRRPWHRIPLIFALLVAPVIAASAFGDADVGPPDTRASTDVATRRAAALAYGKQCKSEAGEPRYCGFDFQAMDGSCACLKRDGVSAGPVVGWTLDRRWHPFSPGIAGIDFARLRWHYSCRQADGIVLGYTPYYTGEPGSQYGPQKMREACLRSPKAAEWDCQIHANLWWTFEEFFDWNMTRIPCSCTGWNWSPSYPCPLSTDPPVPTPVPEPTATPPAPTPLPTPTTSPTPAPAPGCGVPGWCRDQVGLCGPCPGSTPAPTPAPTPGPTATPAPTCPPAVPCPSCPYVPPCPPAPRVTCRIVPALTARDLQTLKQAATWTTPAQRKEWLRQLAAHVAAQRCEVVEQ